MSTPAARPLSPAERELLVVLITDGVDSWSEIEITAEDRAAWLAQVPETFAGTRCGCGTCPSIELVDAEGCTPDAEKTRIVLEASTDGALLLLFIDDDRLSYLELAPTEPEAAFDAFPAASAITG